MRRQFALGLIALVAAGVAGGASTAETRTTLRIYDASGKTTVQVSLADVVRSSVKAIFTFTAPRDYGIYFRLNSRGITAFDQLTRVLAQRGARLGSPQHFAFEVNGRVYARPLVDYRHFPKGLDGRDGVEILGITNAASKALASTIRHG